MSTIPQAVSDMLVTVKSREVQRGMVAEMQKDRPAATRHFLAAAHLELVLASDYTEAGQIELARRSRVSAASCLWRAGRFEQARQELEQLSREFPAQTPAIQQVLADLEKTHPEGDTTLPT
jgi:hypothetical protein